MIRQTKYGYPARAYRPPESRVSVFDPTAGFNVTQPYTELAPGFTPETQNFVRDGAFITPRSGISSFQTATAVQSYPVAAFEFYDLVGGRYVMAPLFTAIDPAVGVFWMEPQDETFGLLAWSSYTTFGSEFTRQTLSQTALNKGWQAAQIYEPARDQNIGIITNDVNLPKYLSISTSISQAFTPGSITTGQFSDYTHCASQFSYARSVAALDYRLIFFNVGSTTTRYPQRVQWTVRGNPLDLNVANGAGFEDLMDMRGEGTIVIAYEDSIYLFTDKEIWRGRKRLDPYAFDFYRINRDRGCPYPHTVQITPRGLIFLADDLELYAIQGDTTIPLGPAEQGGKSRIQEYFVNHIQNPELAFGVVDSRNHTYQLYYTPNNSVSNVFPSRRVDYSLDNGSFFHSAFSMEFCCGLETKDTDNLTVTWDELPIPWAIYSPIWDEPSMDDGVRRVWLLTGSVESSVFTAYRIHSDATNDDGAAIDCRWRSHALGSGEPFRTDHLHEVRFMYQSNSASSVSLWASPDGGASFLNDPFQVRLSASSNSMTAIPCSVSGPAPMFELRINDGSKPKIGRMQARLHDGGDYF